MKESRSQQMASKRHYNSFDSWTDDCLKFFLCFFKNTLTFCEKKDIALKYSFRGGFMLHLEKGCYCPKI